MSSSRSLECRALSGASGGAQVRGPCPGGERSNATGSDGTVERRRRAAATGDAAAAREMQGRARLSTRVQCSLLSPVRAPCWVLVDNWSLSTHFSYKFGYIIYDVISYKAVDPRPDPSDPGQRFFLHGAVASASRLRCSFSERCGKRWTKWAL